MAEAPEPRTPEPQTISILRDVGLSDAERAARLLPIVYDQLRAEAQHVLRGERAGHTLQATALVHEAFLRLVGPRDVPWQSRAHFYAAAAEAMRRVVVDHARRKGAARRAWPEARRAALDLAGLPDPASEEQSAGFLILDDAILRFSTVDPDAAAVVRLRFFAGLSVEDTARALGVSTPTVKRAWAFARGWLKEAIESDRR